MRSRPLLVRQLLPLAKCKLPFLLRQIILKLINVTEHCEVPVTVVVHALLRRLLMLFHHAAAEQLYVGRLQVVIFTCSSSVLRVTGARTDRCRDLPGAGRPVLAIYLIQETVLDAILT